MGNVATSTQVRRQFCLISHVALRREGVKFSPTVATRERELMAPAIGPAAIKAGNIVGSYKAALNDRPSLRAYHEGQEQPCSIQRPDIRAQPIPCARGDYSFSVLREESIYGMLRSVACKILMSYLARVPQSALNRDSMKSARTALNSQTAFAISIVSRALGL